MAQNITKKISNIVNSAEQHIEGEVQKVETSVKNKMDFVTLPPEINLFNMSDDKVTELIYETHVHSDKSFDEDSLFAIVKNILNPATQIVDKIVQGRVHVENVEEFTPKANFSVPLCELKNIGCEFCCKAAGEEVAHKTTISVLKKLSNYEWEAKAVMTIAAFALEYGDFWMVAQNYQSDHLTKSLAILKRAPVLTKPLELKKKRQAVLQLNDAIKTLMQLIQLLDKFEKISFQYDSKEVPKMKEALEHKPVDVYWTILTIVACATKLNLLISDQEKPFDISPYAEKVQFILIKLRVRLSTCRRQMDVISAYKRLQKLMKTPTEIMEIIKTLIFIKDKDSQTIIDGFNNSHVNIEVLRRKHVLLFISSLDITDDEIDIMKPIYEGTKRENQYKIVWIPIVEQWTEELRKKLETLRTKMPWYVVPSYSSPAGIKFIKEYWNFKGKPMAVVLNPQGKQENDDAFHIIKIWGMEAFPFNESKEDELNGKEDWLKKVGIDIGVPRVGDWFKDNKYIFFYGGKDNEWVQQFAKKANAFAKHPTIKESNIKIELACVGKTGKGDEDLGILGRFWSSMESLFFSKTKKSQVMNPVTQEIQKLLSNKNENGWALLSKGSIVVLVCHGFTILKVLEDFDKWKEVVRVNGFVLAFKEYYSKASVSPCCGLDVRCVSGKPPEMVKCPECPRKMETFISYQCCHIDGPMNAYH